MEGAIGPHEGSELTLMLAGFKPLAYFSDDGRPGWASHPEPEFDRQVRAGRFVKAVFRDVAEAPDGPLTVTTVLYALPGEAWRIDAFRLVNTLYAAQAPGWRPDLERVIGALLGYDPADMAAFIARLRARGVPFAAD